LFSDRKNDNLFYSVQSEQMLWSDRDRDRKNDNLFSSVQSNDYAEQMLRSELADDVDGMKSQCCKWNEGMHGVF
jgi:hypothetical protein